MNVKQVQRLVFLAECNEFSRRRLGIAEPLYPVFIAAVEAKIRLRIDQVVVDGNGRSMAPRRPADFCDSEIVFIRSDGWTLGAPLDLANVAAARYVDEWVAIYDVETGTSTPWVHGEIAEERLVSLAIRDGASSIAGFEGVVDNG